MTPGAAAEILSVFSSGRDEWWYCAFASLGACDLRKDAMKTSFVSRLLRAAPVVALVATFSCGGSSGGSGTPDAACHIGGSCCSPDPAYVNDLGWNTIHVTNATTCPMTFVLDPLTANKKVVVAPLSYYYFNQVTAGGAHTMTVNGCGYSAMVNPLNSGSVGTSGSTILVKCSNGDGSAYTEVTTY